MPGARAFLETRFLPRIDLLVFDANQEADTYWSSIGGDIDYLAVRPWTIYCRVEADVKKASVTGTQEARPRLSPRTESAGPDDPNLNGALTPVRDRYLKGDDRSKRELPGDGEHVGHYEALPLGRKEPDRSHRERWSSSVRSRSDV